MAPFRFNVKQSCTNSPFRIISSIQKQQRPAQHRTSTSSDGARANASAGVLLVSSDRQNVVLGVHRKGLCDFGGKRVPSDASRWHTAVRECYEESGVRLSESDRVGSVVVNKGGHEIFVCVVPPGIGNDLSSITPPSSELAITGARILPASELYAQRDALHPRLRWNTSSERRQLESALGVAPLNNSESMCFKL